MLQITDNVIRMTRGDSGTFTIKVKEPNGRVYNLKEQDKIIFYLYKNPEENFHSPLIIKTFEDNNIKLDGIDTRFLEYGDYYWKCELV